jgi:hypothetical protein
MHASNAFAEPPLNSGKKKRKKTKQNKTPLLHSKLSQH